MFLFERSCCRLSRANESARPYSCRVEMIKDAVNDDSLLSTNDVVRVVFIMIRHG